MTRAKAESVNFMAPFTVLRRPDLGKRLARRLVRELSRDFSLEQLDFPLLERDISDSLAMPSAIKSITKATDVLDLAWICTPPSPGSGGHTTLFRMVHGMEKRGHRCTILLYNRHGSDPQKYISLIRQYWPELSANIAVVPDQIIGYHACVASSWETAHVLAARGAAISRRLYFVQDYEPYFYPRGSMYALAEDTYRFGFQHIALGNMTTALLRREAGVTPVTVPFGCDVDTYKLENHGHRNGIAFFARPETDRRGYLTARLALKEFNFRHPEQLITVYGDRVSDLDFPHHHAGHLSPLELNRLYNRCLAGLAMSYTNISLVAEEMLASGARVVVNASSLASVDATNSHIIWGPPTPTGIASALSTAVCSPLSNTERTNMARSVRKGWQHTQDLVATAIEATCREGQTEVESMKGSP
ncbi:rhamnosyltransferase WsaF family glycosyltransferase [Pseudarthrobacter niigatensis]|uniref:Glycosyltransferase involved in cell wall biosynthesis n=1 Tax=Pseudarthrobacter niigatensis TaxID=369935 RepID=A0AAJ1SYF0_9MICC|nr:glycosyltransferase family 1 protein [Pseudarthrobacter niigatensis]MDQ0146991.1 hypothetical protein [Pseudarthrobacter niigatensis]MDQ0267908.1 hypothetical protein [Pseudarthrobacter niigatensis]